MKLARRRTALAATGTFMVCVLGAVAAGGQSAPGQNPPMAETVFKNIQVLKGIPVDEFMDTMGMFAAATAKDCTGCHAPGILTGSRDAFAEATPMIQRARQMVEMMNTINRTSFGGRRRVTCYTCHAGTPTPGRVPNLAVQYGAPLPENPNAMEVIALPGAANQVDQIFAKYIRPLGERSGCPASRALPRTACMRAGTPPLVRFHSRCSAEPPTS